MPSLRSGRNTADLINIESKFQAASSETLSAEACVPYLRSAAMSMNLIQFRPGLPLARFLKQYGSEAKCCRALYRARWPKGFRCPAGADRRRSSFRRRAQTIYQCLAPDAEAYIDGLGCLRRITDAGHAHTVLETSGGRAATEISGTPLGQRRARQRQTRHRWRLPRDQTSQVRAPLPRRSRLPLQPPFPPAIHGNPTCAWQSGPASHAIMACKPCHEPKLRQACNFFH